MNDQNLTNQFAELDPEENPRAVIEALRGILEEPTENESVEVTFEALALLAEAYSTLEETDKVRNCVTAVEELDLSDVDLDFAEGVLEWQENARSTLPREDVRPQLAHLIGPIALECVVALQGELEAAGIEPYSDQLGLTKVLQLKPGISVGYGDVFVAVADWERAKEIADVFRERIHQEQVRTWQTCPKCSSENGEELNRSSLAGCTLMIVVFFGMLALSGYGMFVLNIPGSPVLAVLAMFALWYALYNHFLRYIYRCPDCDAKWR